MICKKCKTEYDKKLKICPNCGTKRKSYAWIIVLSVIAVLLATVIISGVVMYSSIFKATDLGIVPTEEDYQSFTEKTKVQISELPEGKKPSECKITYSGTVEVEEEFTAEEFTVFLNKSGMFSQYTEDVQMTATEDGSIKLCAAIQTNLLSEYVPGLSVAQAVPTVKINGVSVPAVLYVNAEFEGGIKNNTAQNLVIKKIEVLNFDIIPYIKNLPFYENIDTLVTNYLAKYNTEIGLYIEELSTNDNGMIVFKGTLPSIITYEPIQ